MTCQKEEQISPKMLNNIRSAREMTTMMMVVVVVVVVVVWLV